MSATPIERVQEMFTAGDGFDYACRPLDAGLWRCGKCGRGLLTAKSKKCRVCRRPTVCREYLLRPVSKTA